VTIDLTPFGFTPTESAVYEVLLSQGPGTGYAIARSAGLARANAYSALEGLVAKGAARGDAGRPRRFRPEPPEALLARVTERQARALDRLTGSLAELTAPGTTTLVELDSARGTLQVLNRDIARATRSVRLLAPADAYPPLVPALRKAAGASLELALASTGEVALPFAAVRRIEALGQWPGDPLLAVVDGQQAVVAGRSGDQVSGHWTTSPALVRLAELGLEQLLG